MQNLRAGARHVTMQAHVDSSMSKPKLMKLKKVSASNSVIMMLAWLTFQTSVCMQRQCALSHQCLAG